MTGKTTALIRPIHLAMRHRIGSNSSFGSILGHGQSTLNNLVQREWLFRVGIATGLALAVYMWAAMTMGWN
jgi:hypothetical protein